MYEDRRLLLGRMHLAAGIALSIFVAIHFAEDCCYELSIAEGGLIFIMIFTYWRTRSGAALITVENTLMASAMLLFTALLLFESIGDTGIFWVAGLPFVTYFVLQARLARYWMAFYIVVIAIVAMLDLTQVFDTPYAAAQLFCLIAVVLFYWVLAHNYKSQLEHRQMLLQETNHQLVLQQHRMQVVLDHSPIGIWMVDDKRHIQFFNKSWVVWSGISEDQARQVDDYSTLLSDELAEKSLITDRTCLDGDGAYYFRESFPCADGITRTFDMIKVKLADADGKALGLVGFAIDISGKLQAEAEQMTLERRIRYSQRLESFGLMAGGIAHDFNNFLTAIQGSVELAKMERNLSSGLLESLACIDTASKAATNLCRQMLTYSGKGLFKPEQLQLCELVDEMRPLLGASISKNILLQLQQCQQSCWIQGDRSQINQVLLNLVINASEAIGPNNVGEINVSIAVEELAEPETHCFSGAVLMPGQYVVLKVEDNGCGMDAEVIEHMFDPFFTTKFTGRGLGMGAILGVLNAHKAGLEITSEPGSGTIMAIWIPYQGDVQVDCQKAQIQAASNSGRVLVVDDEKAVLHVAKRMLERLGLSVVTACDGREAVGIYNSDHAFDWVLLDVTMPEMDGVECLKKLREFTPDLYVVMSSGYDPESVMMASHETLPNDFLIKPYTIETLRKVVEKASHKHRSA